MTGGRTDAGRGDRRPEEVAIVVRRPGERGTEYLVLLRSAEKLGYWHLVAGGVDWGEEPAEAATRELEEETGLVADPRSLGGSLAYDLAGDPEPVRARFPAGIERITVWPFVADAPPGWEPALDHEHVAARWLDRDGAIALLRYPEPREAVRRAAES
jgi:dATP pyrophosphohydrolase